jgi:reactive intermediate/imine deaminase
MKHLFSSSLFFALVFILFHCQSNEENQTPALSVQADLPSEQVSFLNTPEHEQRNLPFSQAVKVGNTVYLSGNLGALPGQMKLVEGGIQSETRQTLENIKSVLESFGGSMKDIVKCTVFMVDIAEWPAMNEVYVTYFEKPFPARSAVAGSGLALGARVEIECIAVVD